MEPDVIEEVTKVGARGSFTIPAAIRKVAGISPGDIIRVIVSKSTGTMIIRPQVAVDRSQAWFWTPSWQEAEREADEDIEAGRTGRLSPEDFLEEIENW